MGLGPLEEPGGTRFLVNDEGEGEYSLEVPRVQAHAIPKLAHPLICIVGPTASGKSALAQALAEQFAGEIVSADSMQVYRGMDIGTGKVPPEQRTVPYHCLDLVDPGTPYSVALYQRDARRAVTEVHGRSRRPIICGGTGLYVRGVIDGYEYPRGEQTANPLREKFERMHNELGDEGLWDYLRSIDTASAALIHPHNARRVIRALELADAGESYAQQVENLKSIPQVIPATQIALRITPSKLNERIDARVDDMREAGLMGEVEGLMAAGFREALTAPQAIGYKEIVAALEGRCTLDEAFDQVKTATHRYAKRQRSWFNHDSRVQWIDADSSDISALAERALDIVGRMDSESKGEA